MDCLNSIDTVIDSGQLDSLCSSACPIECDYVTYTQVDYTSNYPSQYYIDLVKTQVYDVPLNVTDAELVDYLRNSILKLTVNYDDLAYTSITDTPDTTLEELLGSIGGNAGLFIGISILTLVELIELAAEIVLILVKSKSTGGGGVIPKSIAFSNANLLKITPNSF